MGKGGAKAGFRVMLKYFEIIKSLMYCNFFFYFTKQIDSMLLFVCSVIDHRRRQNVVRTSVHGNKECNCYIILMTNSSHFLLTVFFRKVKGRNLQIPKSKTKEPRKFLSSSNIRGSIFFPVYTVSCFSV